MSGHRQGGPDRRWAVAVVLSVLALALSLTMASPRASAAPTIAYPNLRVLVPTSAISIAHPTPSTRLLDFSHITWNAGAGPLDIRPVYDPATGLAHASQGLYTLTGPSTWAFVQTVPIVKPMVWEPPEDYRFPMTGFGLYTDSGGALGSLVTTGPKVDFCMTADSFVGGVPNPAPAASPPPSNCGDPNAALGLPVGWGDQYDSTDAGEDIDISNLPDGTYWLRAQADPGNYFTQAGTNQSVTDTQLKITGTSVTVLQQLNPPVSLPVVSITSPTPGASVSGATTFAASVSASAPVGAVQFLLDGSAFGAPVTSAPYTLSVASLPVGGHQLSAQATDTKGFVGTAPAVLFTVPTTVGAMSLDQVVSVTGTSAVTTAAFSTPASSETVLAFVGADGPGSTKQTATVSGAGLAWSLVKRSNGQPGDSEIWAATAPSPLSNTTVTATATPAGKHLALTVISVQNSAGVGNSAVASASSGAPTIGVTATRAGSVGFAVGNDWDHATPRTVAGGQTLSSQWVDSGTGDTYWTQYTASPGPAAGQTMTLADIGPTGDRWNLAAVELLAPTGPPPPPPPTVAITSPIPGQTVSGTVTVAATAGATAPATVASVQLLLDGQPLGPALTTAPYSFAWSTVATANGPHTLGARVRDSTGASGTAATVAVTVNNPPPPTVVTITSPTAGQTVTGTIPITVTVTGPASIQSVQLFLDGLSLGTAMTTAPYSITWDTTTSLNGSHTLTAVATDVAQNKTSSTGVTVTVANVGVCFNTDVNVVAQGKGPVTTAAFHTALAGELLLAFVGADGPRTGGQTATVSGAGLSWTLVKRANSQPGDSEIWTATAPSVLTAAQVTATLSKTGYDAFLNVLAIQGAAGVGASVAGSAGTGAPSVSLTTSGAQSLVYGVGNDWDNATNHVAATNQVIGRQWLDTGTGDAYWAQNTTIQAAAGSLVKLADVSPITDKWNLVAVELLADSS